MSVIVFDSSEKMKDYIENLKKELEEKEQLVAKFMKKYEEEVAELEVLKKMGATIDEKEATLKIELEGVPVYIKPNPLKVYDLLRRVEKEIEAMKSSISTLESIAEKLADLPGFAVIVEMKDGKVVAAYMDRLTSV
jgi:DNA repair exonuclease SbcCD ATPase subunit